MKNLFVILFLLISNISFATNYYVDATNGMDTYDGLSPSTAWKTIARVNSANLIAGDSVLFKRGETFRGNLIPISGTALGNIIYGAYGTGNKPKLLGSIQKNSVSDWVNEGGNIWHTSQQAANTVGSELLPNSDFTANTSNWDEWHNTTNGASCVFSRTTTAGEYYTSPGGGKLVCTNNGTGNSDIQLWASNCSITSAKWYKFIFKAKASQQFTIPYAGIALMKNVSPYTSYSSSSSKAVNVTTSWATYEIFYKSNATATDARVDFLLGNIIPDGATFYFDSLSFKELDGDPGLISIDVGNIIFNNESFCGIKMKTEAEVNAQGKFWYDQDNVTLKIYSISNPASFYSNIEIALTKHIIDENGKSYDTYENLDLRYGAAHGIGGGNTHHIRIKDMDISWIGGGYLVGYGDGKVRYGNGVEFWSAAHDNIVERCVLNQVYDAALTHQGEVTSGYETYNIYFRNNIVNNSEYSYELWGRPSNSSLHDIYFENNTCMNAGFGWGHSQRPDPNGTHLIFWGFVSQSNNVYIRNNIFYESSDYSSRYDNNFELTKVTIDYNCWYESSGPVARIVSTNYDFATQWTAYKTASGQDAHSIPADPLLNPDYTLTNNSPCIDTGITSIIVTEDYNQTLRPQGNKYDIGAFEYIIPTGIENKNNLNEIHIYPNPANTQITIEFSSQYSVVSIYNLSGQEIKKLRAMSHELRVDISNLPSGIYFVKVVNEDGVSVGKFVKE
ncbi:MAG: T9SS type A sorting domain-containing protein [Bacteroidales bacterium]|nr:T9SS type A sorting domain-containing protein [Bacteroidales bacterium]